MLEIVGFYILSFSSLGLVSIYIWKSGPAPLAAIFLWLGLAHGLIFKPTLVLLSGYNSFIGAYVLYGTAPLRFWQVGTYVAAGYCLLGLLLLLLEYFFGTRGKLPTFQYYRGPRKVYFDTVMCSGFLIMSWIALTYFLKSNPSLLALEGKNSLATTNLNEYSGGSGLTRLVINFGYVIVFLMLHNIAVGFRVQRSKIIALLAGGSYLIYAVFADQRALILVSVLSWGLFGYFSGVKYSKKIKATALFCMISMIFLISYQRVLVALSTNVENILGVFANFAGRNFIDITKTISILDAQYQIRLGATFVDSFTILVPRALYPEKTTVNIDTLIASEVFGAEYFGAGAVPPGMFGEMIFNFGLLGVPLGLIFCAVIVWFTDSLRYHGRSLYLMFYTMSLYMVAIGILGSSFQSTFLGAVSIVIPLYSLHKLALRRF